MIWLQFLASATLVILAAGKLAEYADVIAYRTGLGGLFIGTFLLGMATSLPELLTALNAIQQGVPNLSAGDFFGSSMFNMLILAVLDLLVSTNAHLAAYGYPTCAHRCAGDYAHRACHRLYPARS